MRGGRQGEESHVGGVVRRRCRTSDSPLKTMCSHPPYTPGLGQWGTLESSRVSELKPSRVLTMPFSSYVSLGEPLYSEPWLLLKAWLSAHIVRNFNPWSQRWVYEPGLVNQYLVLLHTEMVQRWPLYSYRPDPCQEVDYVWKESQLCHYFKYVWPWPFSMR